MLCICNYLQECKTEIKLLFKSCPNRLDGEKGKDMITRTWKVNGVLGHRQRESFNKSYKWDFSEGNNVRIIEVENSDKTGTNDYSIVRITRNTAEECEAELNGQITDGIFENSNVDFIEEINE